MVKKSNIISATVHMKATAGKSGKSLVGDDEGVGGFSFGWEGTAYDPLTYIAREIVDQVWPNTSTPDVVNGVWDNTPIMQAVMAALKRGIELSGKDIASEGKAAEDRENAA